MGDTLTRIRDSSRGAWGDNWLERPRDISFVLDSLDMIEEKVPALKGRLDRERMAVGGHSLGAYTAQVAGGATVEVPGRDEPQSSADPRLRAILQLSGQGTNQQGLHRNSWDKVSIPMMCVTGSLDGAAQGQPPLWRREPFQYAPPGNKYFLFIEGAHHGSFTGKLTEADAASGPPRGRWRELLQARPSSRTVKNGTPGDQRAIFEWVKQATTAFWDASLKHDMQAQSWLASDSLVTLSHGAVRLERK